MGYVGSRGGIDPIDSEKTAQIANRTRYVERRVHSNRSAKRAAEANRTKVDGRLSRFGGARDQSVPTDDARCNFNSYRLGREGAADGVARH